MSSIKSAEEQASYVVQVREWINGQPHLPKDLDDHLLLRFAHSCYYDLEETKKTIETFSTVRSSCSDLLTNRDPLSPHVQKMLKVVLFGNYMITGNRRLWVWQLNDPGLETYDYALDAKVFFLSTDAFFMTDTGLPEMDIVLLDAKDISLKFITKINLSVARKLSKYQEDAIPIRLKQIHVINAPSVIDKIYAILKPFMKKQNAEMIHFHTPKSETLYKYINKDDLPEDYGGLKPSLAEITEKSLKIVMDKRLFGNYMITGNRRLWVWQLNDPGLETYDYALDAKVFFLSTDAFFMTDTGLPEMDIVLLDAKDISLKFITKINLSVARKLSKYQEDAIPIRLKQIHVVNAPSVIDKIYAILKPFMKKQNAEMIHFHTPKSETLYKYINKDDLPEDYGGLKPSLAEITEKSLKIVMDKREQLLNDNLWRVKKTETTAEFRKLAID